MRPHALLSSFLAPVTVMLSPSARNCASSPAEGAVAGEGRVIGGDLVYFHRVLDDEGDDEAEDDEAAAVARRRRAASMIVSRLR